MKVQIHTKTGNVLSYNEDGLSAQRILSMWGDRLLKDPPVAVSAGRYAILVSQIDFVEVRP